MSDLIRREDIRTALKENVIEMGGDDWCEPGIHCDDIDAIVNSVPSADRPRGKVNAVKIYEQASHDLEFGYITLGEFEERTEPLKHLYYDRPRGEWIKYAPEDIGCYNCECSLCRERFFIPLRKGEVPYSFCPNCGADMREREGE